MFDSIKKKSNEVMKKQTKRQIVQMYRDWRKANGNRKPNQAIVRIHWDDEDGDDTHVGTIGLENMDCLKFVDNPAILWYCRTLAGLFDLRTPDNGSDFVLCEVVEFYHTKK